MRHSLRRLASSFAFIGLLAIGLAACGGASAAGSSTVVRLGYFPNVTHAVALVGVARGTFKANLGQHASLQTTTFNAGPALIEAIFAGDIDIGYVGPSPAINGYVKSHGQALRIIAGAASGGALFIVRPGAHITSPSDLRGKKLATPQLGNTQDVALRFYLQQHGLKPVDQGGTVQIIPTDNANILALFKQGQIDGAWVPEPWASRLILEGKGQVFVDERTLWPNGQFVTTNVVVRTQFLKDHPDLVASFLKAHIETVRYINAHPDAAKIIVNSELKRITGKSLAPAVLDRAFTTLAVTYDPLAQSLVVSADHAYALGFLGASKPNLTGVYDLQPLNQALAAQGLAPVTGP